ncbi:MAG: hypothetical protein LBJ59_09110 [Zoogloeaceae bacterium]|jgi:hypothetical protein|nr:hypothetical protein [Zoogloeaceae bacterium]
MSKLGKKALAEIVKRGGEVSEDVMGTIVSITTSGMAWLMNGSTEPRELRVKAFMLPVYEEKEYVSFCFYLNGSPPGKIYMHHNGNPDFPTEFSPDIQVWERFGFHKDWDVIVRFSEQEIAQLKEGKVLRITPPKP